MIFIAIGLSGNYTIYNIGSSAHVNCYSNFTMLSITWRIASHNVKFSTVMVGSQGLLLTVTDISRDIHNTTFICEVVNILPCGTRLTNRTQFVIMTEELSKSLESYIV